MATVERRLSDLPPLTPEQRALREAQAKDPSGGLDYPDLAGWTPEEKARSTRASDYPSFEDAMDEAGRLADMQEAGMGVEELEAYKKSRIGRFAAV